MHIPGLTDNGDTTSIADTNELMSSASYSLDASSTPHIPSQQTTPNITVVTVLHSYINPSHHTGHDSDSTGVLEETY